MLLNSASCGTFQLIAARFSSCKGILSPIAVPPQLATGPATRSGPYGYPGGHLALRRHRVDQLGGAWFDHRSGAIDVARREQPLQVAANPAMALASVRSPGIARVEGLVTLVR
jgi:hypothetical protein